MGDPHKPLDYDHGRIWSFKTHTGRKLKIKEEAIVQIKKPGAPDTVEAVISTIRDEGAEGVMVYTVLQGRHPIADIVAIIAA